MMKEQLAKIEREALEAITGAEDPAALDELRVKYLGKKGELTAVLKQMGKLSAEERPAMGALANEVRAVLEETLELTASILGKSNDSAASDLGVSALSLRAAIQGAWLNVLINIGSLKNKELAEDYRAKGEALLAKALPLADQIYDTVVKSM